MSPSLTFCGTCGGDLQAGLCPNCVPRQESIEKKRRGAIAVAADEYLSDMLRTETALARAPKVLVERAWELAELMADRRGPA